MKDGARQSCIPLTEPDAWRSALKGVEHAFAHTWGSCHAMHLTTGHPTFLYCYEEGDVRIVCPIAERSFGGYTDIVTPYGFSGFTGTGPAPHFPEHWRGFVRERGYVCGYVSLHPLLGGTAYGSPGEVYGENVLYVLDLERSLAQIHDGLDRNRKRQLRDWERLSERFTFDRERITEFLLAHYTDFIRGICAPQASYLSPATLRSLCSLDDVYMVGAGDDGRLEAVYLFGHTPYVGECLFNVPLPEGRRHATALLWQGLIHLKSMGVPALHMGGGVRANDSIAHSKLRFGSRPVPFHCLKQVYRPDAYRELCRRGGVDPDDRTGYFPAYRRPGLATLRP
jgi:hypothetical protein